MASFARPWRGILLVLFTLSQSLRLAAGAAIESTGHEGCECIATSVLREARATNSTETSCFWPSLPSRIPGTKDVCYPVDYGSEKCASWDLGLEPYCSGTSSPLPAFCSEPWCYVDPNSCRRVDVQFRASVYEKGLYYSSATCVGNESSFDGWYERALLKGKTLRVAVPASRYPDNYRLNASGAIVEGADENEKEGVGPYLGYDASFFSRIAALGEFKLNYTFVSRGSRASHSNLWTACVADVQRGILDLCPSATLVLAERANMAQFTAGFYTARFHLLVKKPRTHNAFLDRAVLIYKPFKPSLWAWILACLVLIGCLSAYLQYCHEVRDARRLAMMLQEASHHKGQVFNLGTISHALRVLADMVYRCVLDFLGGGVSGGPEDNPSLRVLRVGFGVFAMMVLSIYTANLTSFLVVTRTADYITSINDCVHRQCHLCYPDVLSLGDLLKRRYGRKINYVPSPRGVSNDARRSTDWAVKQVKAGADKGGCDAAVLDADQYAFAGIDDCDVMWLQAPLFSIEKAAPVASEYAQGISYILRLMSPSIENNEYENLMHEYVPNVQCSGWTSSDQAATDAHHQIGVEDLSGPFFSVFVAAIAAVFLHIFGGISPRANGLSAQQCSTDVHV